MQLGAPPGSPAHPGADLRVCTAAEDLFEVHRVSGRGLRCPASSSCVAFITWLALGQDGQNPQEADAHPPPHLSIVFPSFPSAPSPAQPGFPQVRTRMLPLGPKPAPDGMTQDPFVNPRFLGGYLRKSVDNFSIKLFCKQECLGSSLAVNKILFQVLRL